jgi:hypothetical protein
MAGRLEVRSWWMGTWRPIHLKKILATVQMTDDALRRLVAGGSPFTEE